MTAPASSSDPAESPKLAQAAPTTDRTGQSGGGSEPDPGTLHQLWRFREFARPQLPGPLVLGVEFRAAETLADLATPWPLALVINDLLGGHANGTGGPLAAVARWSGGSAWAILLVAGAPTLLFTVLSGLFDHLGTAR